MQIILNNAGKRFSREWIFRNLNYEFTTGKSYAITGPNGSGKSTLLQIISASMLLNEGQAKWISNKAVEPDTVHFYISFAAPYLELIEEMTAKEFLYFHSRFKNFIEKFSASEILDRAGLIHAADKQIRYFSSGMKQRLKLAQAIFSDVPVILLDEPCTNLDASGGRDTDGDDYEKMPKGNLDVTGRYFIWTTNTGGGRLDAFIVKIPAERLTPP